MDQAGNLYGTTSSGGLSECYEFFPGCGTVFELKPPETPCLSAPCPWTEIVLHTFTGGSDGAFPAEGDLIFDQAGNLYGTTEDGGLSEGCDFGCGTVFKLSPSGSGWTETILYSFAGGNDGEGPIAGLVFDRAGNLYGTTVDGGLPNCGVYPGCGTVFELSPSGSGWTESVLYRFAGGDDGWLPAGGVILDSAGNIYGTTQLGGESGAGTVFELSPSNGHWTKEILYSFRGESGPEDSLVMDGEGSLYGTSYAAGAGDGHGDAGVVFKLMPNASGQWTYTSLHDFACTTRTCPDGSAPTGNVIFDSNGNLYGTTTGGGRTGSTNDVAAGIAWQITP